MMFQVTAEPVKIVQQRTPGVMAHFVRTLSPVLLVIAGEARAQVLSQGLT
jgi:hypothetical protein